MEVFGYTRISVDLDEDSRENTSIENQKKIITDFVGSAFPDAHLTLFEDRDRSGYTFSQRESYQKMRSQMMSGECTILVVKDFSRFSRRNSLGLLELETLRDAGIRIISIGDGIDYPTKDDWMLIQFKFLMNEMPVTDRGGQAGRNALRTPPERSSRSSRAARRTANGSAPCPMAIGSSTPRP